MLDLGLTPAEGRIYTRTIAGPHWRRIEFQILDGRTGRLLGAVDPVALDGEVDGDRKRTPNLMATVSFLDPDGRLPIEPNEDGDLAVHRSKQLRIIDHRWIPGLVNRRGGLGRWVPAPVFTGPFEDADRDGPVVTAIAHDPSVYGMADNWAEQVYAKGAGLMSVIRRMAKSTGETRFSLSASEAKLPDRTVVKRFGKVWPKIRSLANARDMLARYDGRGTLVVRRTPEKPQATQPRSSVLSTVQVDKPTEVQNAVLVIGGKPKGQRKKPRSKVHYLPAWHPDRHTKIGRGIGKDAAPRRFTKRLELKKLKSERAANARARREIREMVRGREATSVQIVPDPRIELGDLRRIPHPFGVARLRVGAYTLPLGFEGSPAMVLSANRSTDREARGGGNGKGGGGGGKNNGGKGGGKKNGGGKKGGGKKGGRTRDRIQNVRGR